MEKVEVDESVLESVGKPDVCPHCGTKTRDFKYINVAVVRTFGWLECTACGVVFSPMSIRKQKMDLQNRKIVTPSEVILK